MGDSRILIGTAGWTDKSLIDCGKFYPPSAKSPEERLRFYAAHFPMVEVDSSYYGLPVPRNAQLWAKRTPPKFRFNVKAFRLFTGHQTPPQALPKDIREALKPGTKNIYYRDLPEELRQEMWNRFRTALEPLRAAGKLGAVHFQFAPWLAFHPENFQHIQDCRQRLADFQLAVEFRNSSWFTPTHGERTLAFERELNLANVVVDEPQGFTNSIPSVWEVTSPGLALVRLHGRNRETWNLRGLNSSADRFNYDYSEFELSQMASSIRKLSAAAGQVDVVFNNNNEDQGQRNARSLMSLLS